MLGTLTNKLPDDALVRIADPTALWGTRVLIGAQDRRCYIGHAIGAHRDHRGFCVALASDDSEYAWETLAGTDMHQGGRFDALCSRFGLARIARACRMRAERVLSSRGLVPQEPRGVREAVRT